jgi:tRNA dimethylallyltransferase
MTDGHWFLCFDLYGFRPMTAAHALPCIAIAGPTASGKTAAALALAERLAQRGQKAEIISVDSALVYKGMDIGTAKPTAAELAAVPHHLIDIIDPLQAYSAAEFVRDTQKLVDEIRARNAIPLLVGGTMLYFKALMDGLDDMPAANPEVRAMLDAQAAELGWPAMHARLAEVDPVTAARLAPGDSQRIQRARGLAGLGQTAFELSHDQGGPRRTDGTCNAFLAGACRASLAAPAHCAAL